MMMKNTILILLLILLGLSCSDKDAPDIEIPQVELFSEEGIRLLKQYAIEADSVIQKHKDAFRNQNVPFNIYKVSTDIRALDAVQVTTVNTYTETSILIEYKNGLYLDCLVIGKDEEDLVGDGKQEDPNCYRLASEISGKEGYNIPIGKNAVIIAPFQEEFNEDFTLIKKYLTAIGFKIETYINEQVTTDLYKGSFLKNYDVIYISTHASYNSILSGIQISKETANRPNVTPVAFRGKVYEGDIPLMDSKDTPFPNSLVYLDANKTFGQYFANFTDDHQAGCYIGSSKMVNIKTTKEAADLVFKYLSEGNDIESIETHICIELSKPFLLASVRDYLLPFYLVAPTDE